MGINTLARDCGHLGALAGTLRRPIGRRGPALPMRPNPVQRVRTARRYRIVVDVRHLFVHLGRGRRSLHGPSRLSRLGGAQRIAHRSAAVLYAMRNGPIQPIHAAPARIAERHQQRPIGHGDSGSNRFGPVQGGRRATEIGRRDCGSKHQRTTAHPAYRTG